jgi:peptidoglycan/LPS O-acetylase OafA/YrhL
MLGVGDKVIARFPALIAWVLAPAIQFAGALAIAFLATHLIEWPFLRWRESIPWLRDTKPLGVLWTASFVDGPDTLGNSGREGQSLVD